MEQQNNSVTVQVYYKGFSILLTNRDNGTPLEQFLTESQTLVDKAIQSGCEPSWNDDTNRKFGESVRKQASTQWVDEGEGLPQTQLCGTCGAATEMKSGTGQFGPWTGFKCTTGRHMGFVQKDKSIKWKDSQR